MTFRGGNGTEGIDGMRRYAAEEFNGYYCDEKMSLCVFRWIKSLEQERDRYRKALEFYASPDAWNGGEDYGAWAKEALGIEE